jgi:DNA-binding NtrC family response regulator
MSHSTETVSPGNAVPRGRLVAPPESWPVIGLVNVSEPYSGHIAERAREGGMRVVTACDGSMSPHSLRRLRLCIAQMDPSDGARGPESMRALRETLGPVPVVVLGEAIPMQTAVQLAQMGAADVIEIPAAASEVADRALGRLGVADPSEEVLEVVGESAVMARLRSEIATVAASDSTVLLTGETGTGKGLVARAIHRLSRRRDHPFVHVDCTGLSATVIESEFFGHERGAFTGAVGRREGRFELAREGTIFLDEIGDFDPQLQSKLLRVLQDRQYERVGGTRTLAMTARVVAATNQDLERAVADKLFRSDLYFRLNVVHLRLPSLRDHLEDVPSLVSWGLRQLGRSTALPVPTPTDVFLARLMSHPWPGNVRELMNVLERVMVQYRGVCPGPDELDRMLDGGSPLVGGDSALRVAAPPLAAAREGEGDERRRIASALIATGGNVARAARRLNIPRSTLRYRVKVHDLGSLIPQD